PVFPNQSSCSNSGNMFMNYLDYTRDTLMDMFSNNQKLKMRSAIEVTRTNFLTDNGKCNYVTTPQNDIAISAILYPYGFINERVVKPQIRLINNGQNAIDSCMIYYNFFRQDLHNVKWKGHLPPNDFIDVTLPEILDSIETGFLIAYAKYIEENIIETDTINNFCTRSFVVDPNAIIPQTPEGIYIWNNPSNGFYQLKFDSLIQRNFEITVFNLIGQRINFDYENNSQNLIDLNLLNAVEGFYLVRIRNGKTDFAAKLLKLPSK
ncbi:MAG: zinc-dependent metalloprotease, partial [Ignavibacteria bacterium]|nr:zinc-dependent metalloprotease [Ignavibacteria bacterium]